MEPKQITRPAADFMTDEAFDKIVNCTECGDEIIEAFRSTHFCDPVKI